MGARDVLRREMEYNSDWKRVLSFSSLRYTSPEKDEVWPLHVHVTI